MHDKERQSTLHAQIMGQSVTEQKSREKSSEDLESYPIPALLYVLACIRCLMMHEIQKKITQSIAIAARKHKKEQIVERKNRKKMLSSLWRVEVALLPSVDVVSGGKVESGCEYIDGVFRVLNSLILKYLHSPPLIEISSEPKMCVWKKILKMFMQISYLLFSIPLIPNQKSLLQKFWVFSSFFSCVCMHVECRAALCIENSVFYIAVYSTTMCT